MVSPISEVQLCEYLDALTDEQRSNVVAIRSLLATYAPDLTSQVDTGKWFGGLITYSTKGGTFCFAVGPRSAGYTTFHMMPFYGSKTLQERHGPALKKFLSGKSCIRFKHYSDLPEPSLIDIIDKGGRWMSENYP